MGGLGSLLGAVLGGLLLGAIEIYLAAYLPDSALPFHGAHHARASSSWCWCCGRKG